MTTAIQILKKIGHGGMGDVYLGVQRGAVNFQRLVVIKQIHKHLFAQQNQRQMFVDEASLVASLAHPNIVRIVDFKQTNSSFFIVMEYVDGETFRSLLALSRKNRKPLPFAIACKLILPACEALSYAHNMASRDGKPLNIIHRDIGLHNLMIDRNGYVKVIDFGIAKSDIQADRTNPGMLKGNPSYMAPDLFLSSKIDHRVDIYAAGLCLYELLTQQRAFQFEKNVQLAEIIEKVTGHDFKSPSAINPKIPVELDGIVQKAIAKNREERYGTMAEMVSDLRNISTIYMKEFEAHDIRSWFHTHFSERIQLRIHTENELLAAVDNSEDASVVNTVGLSKTQFGTESDLSSNPNSTSSFNSMPPSANGLFLPPPPVNGISMPPPVSGTTTGAMSAIQQVNGLKPVHLLAIIGLMLFLTVGAVTGIYVLFNGYADSDKQTGYSKHSASVPAPEVETQQVSITLQPKQKMSTDTDSADFLTDVSTDTAILENENDRSMENISSKNSRRRKRKMSSLAKKETDQIADVQATERTENVRKTAKSKIHVPLLEKNHTAKVPMLDKPEKNGVPMLE